MKSPVVIVRDSLGTRAASLFKSTAELLAHKQRKEVYEHNLAVDVRRLQRKQRTAKARMDAAVKEHTK